MEYSMYPQYISNLSKIVSPMFDSSSPNPSYYGACYSQESVSKLADILECSWGLIPTLENPLPAHFYVTSNSSNRMLIAANSHLPVLEYGNVKILFTCGAYSSETSSIITSSLIANVYNNDFSELLAYYYLHQGYSGQYGNNSAFKILNASKDAKMMMTRDQAYGLNGIVFYKKDYIFSTQSAPTSPGTNIIMVNANDETVSEIAYNGSTVFNQVRVELVPVYDTDRPEYKFNGLYVADRLTTYALDSLIVYNGVSYYVPSIYTHSPGYTARVLVISDESK